jgi:hypothetical protein
LWEFKEKDGRLLVFWFLRGVIEKQQDLWQY